MEKIYVAYYRLSKQGKREKGLGLEAQEQIVRHYYKPTKEFTEIKSRKNIKDRPILMEAIKYCLDNGYYLVTAKVDRLSGNVDDARYVLEALKGRLYCCDIPGEVDKFTLTLFTAFAERERELISLRTSQALQSKIKLEGKWQKPTSEFMNGNIAKLGNKAMKDKASANENNQRASSIICALRKEGKPFNEILEHLNKNKFQTSTGKPFISITQVQRIHSKFC